MRRLQLTDDQVEHIRAALDKYEDHWSLDWDAEKWRMHALLTKKLRPPTPKGDGGIGG